MYKQIFKGSEFSIIAIHVHIHIRASIIKLSTSIIKLRNLIFSLFRLVKANQLAVIHSKRGGLFGSVLIKINYKYKLNYEASFFRFIPL